MALRQILSFSEICSTCSHKKGVFADARLLNYQKTFRTFKRTREPSPKIKLEPQPPFEAAIETVPLTWKNLGKPFAFTVAFSSTCYVGSTIWQYEAMRNNASLMKKTSEWLSVKAHTSREKAGSLRKELNKWWKSLSDGEKLFIPICAANILVFAAWRMPQLHAFMLKYFCSNPASKATCWPMLLSTFSHYSAFHLFANMYVLHSFSSGSVSNMGKEQFLGFYLSAGVISSFASHVYKTIARQPGMSLGASGAIMAVLGYVCTQYPDTRLGIIFLPFINFSAGSAIKAIVALDFAGVCLGWRFFDHAAHLGGAAFGIFWALWGQEHIWQKRSLLLNKWHDFRSSHQK